MTFSKTPSREATMEWPPWNGRHGMGPHRMRKRLLFKKMNVGMKLPCLETVKPH